MAQVKVWYPKVRAFSDMGKTQPGENPIYSVIENVGHASLLLDGLANPTYVSWWPDQTHTSFSTPSLVEDRMLEGGLASQSVQLNCLDENSIMHWWNRIKLDGRATPYRAEFYPKDDKWTLDDNNCSHMVAMAMDIGGASRYCPKPTFGTGIMTPFQVLGWARAIQLVAKFRQQTTTLDTHKPSANDHLASLLSGSSEADPKAAQEINATASINLMLMAQERGIGSFVFSSTMASLVPGGPMHLTGDIQQWLDNVYSATKVAVERIGFRLKKSSDFDF